MYIPFNPNVPEGAHTPPVYADEDLANIRALRDAVVSAFMPGWSYSRDFPGGAPAGKYFDEFTWASGVFRLRLRLQFDSASQQPETALWSYSENSGAAYAIISTGGTPSAITAATDGIDAVDKDAGAWVGWVGAVSAAYDAGKKQAAHAALVGPAVHGLGSMSTQNANAVAITGGDVSGVKASGLTRLSPANPPALGAGPAVIDWAATPTQIHINAGGTISGFANAVAGEMKRIVVLGNGPITINLPGMGLAWGVGHPVYGANWTILNFVCIVPGTFFATSIPL